MEWPPELGSDGWCLLSAERRHAEAPDTFWIPSREAREGLSPGNGAKLLFKLADQGRGTLDVQVEKMWVVVTSVTESAYEGILASVPASSHAQVGRGSVVRFSAEHICDIDGGPPPDELETLLHFANPS